MDQDAPAVAENLKAGGHVLDILKALTDAKNDAELARRLDVPQSTVSSWRKRDVIPYEACAKIAAETGTSLDWMLFGSGTRVRGAGIDLDLLRLAAQMAYLQFKHGPYEPEKFADRLIRSYNKLRETIDQEADHVMAQVRRDNIIRVMQGQLEALNEPMAREFGLAGSAEDEAED